ncbi:MAG: hypothetical protein ACD_60C00030G0014 [uncultured bacterium]|nr:MAG: hypothetical protein ACD_60C00030G0014 [uncultured bacterium]
MRLRQLREFLKLESTSGIILIITALLALILDNSPFAHFYESSLHVPVSVHLGGWQLLQEPLLFWVNEGLMPLFFLLIGLELKRELLIGHLSERNQVALPAIAAFGGMLVPAFIYTTINFHHPALLKGWAIPVATDIVFALGILSLFGRRVPIGLKLFLMALAIFDDIGAILIIALFYGHALLYFSLLLALIVILVLALMNRFKVDRLFPYLLVGFLLWGIVLKTGIHATVAGVLLAFFIPLKSPSNLLEQLERALHPWVAYVVMPAFAFANAGLSFSHVGFSTLTDTVTLGIVWGLFIGKQLGVFSFAAVMIKLGFAKLPEKTSWLEFYGIAILCGIGFTMSLFLGTLAFENGNPSYLVEVRLGVLLGSLLSALMSIVVLLTAFWIKKKRTRA